MARVFLNNNAINQKGTPLLYTDILSNRPQYGINGRLFFSTDSQQIFEDTGTSWLLLADATGSVSGYVPYTGATTNLNLGLFNITASSFISGNFTTGSVLFIGSSNNINQDNSNFFWDDTNNRLGIGTNIPGTYIDVHGTSNVLMQLNNIDVSGNLNTTIAFQNQNIANWRIGNYPNGGQQIFKIYDVLNSRDSLTIIGTQINTLLDFTAAKITGNYIVKSGGTSSQILAADGSVITAGTNIIISGGTISSSGGTTTNALTLNNSGTGAASGTTFNGSNAITLSYNTIGAQQALTLTTTGTSGAATLISGTLNIPNYTPDLSGYVTLATTQTLTGFKTFNPSVTASGAIARGGYYTPALTAAANNDVLVGLDVNPTFINGAFTGVKNYAARISSNLYVSPYWTSFLANTGSSANIPLGVSGISLGWNRSNGLGESNLVYGIANGGSAPKLEIASWDGTTYSARMSISNVGVVTFTNYITGVTTTSTVAGNGLNGLNIATSNQGANGITFQGVNTNSMYIGRPNGSTDDLIMASSTAELIRLKSTGNFLIGSTTDNGKKLQVNGTTTTVGFAASGATYTVSAIVSEQYYHVFQGGTGQTLTLLSPSSNNLQYVIINNSANTLTVAANGANNIYTPSGTIVSSITLIAYQRVFIIADGNNKYYQIF